MRAIPELVYGFLRKEELYVGRVYDDAYPLSRQPDIAPGYEPKGTLTGGYGHTGPDVVPGMTVSKTVAEAWLRRDVHTAASAVCAVVLPAVLKELTDHQYAALISFVFNVGAGQFRASTLLKRVNACQFDQVPVELAKWVNQTQRVKDPKTGKLVRKKVKVDGLVRRRAAETVLWSTLEPGSVEEEMPSSVVRRAELEPTPAEPSKGAGTVAIGGGGLVTGGLSVLSEKAENAQPLLDTAQRVNDVVSPWSWVINALAAVPEPVRMALLGAAAMLAAIALWNFYKAQKAARS